MGKKLIMNTVIGVAILSSFTVVNGMHSEEAVNTPYKLCRELGGVSDDKCSIKNEGTLRNWCFFFIKKSYELL